MFSNRTCRSSPSLKSVARTARSPLQIERRASGLHEQRLEVVRSIDPLQEHRSSRIDLDVRRPVAVGKGRSQLLVPREQCVQGARERDLFNPSVDANSHGHVVRRVVGQDFFQEPQLQLRERRDRFTLEHALCDFSNGCRHADLLRDILDSRCGEELAQSERNSETFANPGQEPDRHQRMSAQLEEILVDADRFDAE